MKENIEYVFKELFQGVLLLHYSSTLEVKSLRFLKRSNNNIYSFKIMTITQTYMGSKSHYLHIIGNYRDYSTNESGGRVR